jgi:DNA-binding response OmpR family regulator
MRDAVEHSVTCIEDDRKTAKLIANELSEPGFYVVIAYDSSVGLSAILKRIPDLVLCDVGLPEMSGFEILSNINVSPLGFKRIPFIFLTGWTSREDELKGRSLGADDYVTKPIDFDILEEIIKARLTSGVVRHDRSTLPPKVPSCRAPPPTVMTARAMTRSARSWVTSSPSTSTTRSSALELWLLIRKTTDGLSMRSGRRTLANDRRKH